MQLCSDSHDEIAYESRKCPLCEMKSELESQLAERETTILDQESEIENLTDQCTDLTNEISRLNEKIKWQDISDYLQENE